MNSGLNMCPHKTENSGRPGSSHKSGAFCPFVVSGKLLAPVLFFLFLYAGLLHAQYRVMSFDHISRNNGLSQSAVFAIAQDQQGFIWFGTQDGLNRYDGYTFKVFKHISGKSNSISDNWVNVLCPDRAGNLWIGTAAGGLNRYDSKTESFLSYQHNDNDTASISSNNVTAIYEDQQGLLWVGTNGGGLERFNRKTGRFQRDTRIFKGATKGPDQRITAISGDSLGNLWIGTAGSGISVLPADNNAILVYHHDDANPKSPDTDQILCFYPENNGDMWIGTNGSGLIRYNAGNKTFSKYVTDPAVHGTLSDNHIYTIFKDADSNLWIGTDNGLNLYDSKNDRFVSFRNDPANSHSLSNNLIRGIYEDHSGILWIATYGGGLNKFDKKKAVFRDIRRNPADSNSLSDNNIWSICEDHRGQIWVGTNNGLNRWNRKTNTYTHFYAPPQGPGIISHNVVRTICEDRSNRLWIGTDGGGVDVLDPMSGTADHYKNDPANPNSLSDNRIRHIFLDRQGSLWFATWNGLNRFDSKTKRFKIFQNHPENPNSLSDNRVRTIFQDHLGALWIGTYGGLNLYDQEQQQFIVFKNNPTDKLSLSNDRVLCIYEDHNGTIWLGTYGGGLDKFDRDEFTFTHYTVEDGLPNDVIYGILEDDAGELWLSTNKGLSHFDPERETFQNYDVNDGLQSDEFNGGAYLRSAGGEVFFGGINGFTMFYPNDVKGNQYIPPVVITTFRKYDKPVELKESISQIPEIRLSYKDDFFSFEFASLDYTNPEKNEYAYQLEGFDKDWIYSGNRRYASYTNLNGGEYLLRVRGANSDGVWNNTGVALKVIITPPFWATWWFRISAALSVILVGVVTYKIRISNIEAKKRKLELLVAQRTHELNQRNRQLIRAQKSTDDILNNVEEGLFLLTPDLRLDQKYSEILETILNKQEIGGKSFIRLIQNHIPDNIMESAGEYLQLMFRKDVDEETLDELNPLSRVEFHISDEQGGWVQSRHLAFKFKRIMEDGVIINLIATVEDITNQIVLTQKLEETESQTRQQMEWLVNILHIDPPLLREFIDGVQKELQYIDTLLKGHEIAHGSKAILEEIYRSMHLIKGNASLLDLKFFAEQAHNFEESIDEIRKKEKPEGKDFIPLILKYSEINQNLREIKKLIDRISRFHQHFRPKRSYESQLLIKSLQNLVQNLARDLGKEIDFVHKDFEGVSIPFSYRLLVKEILIQLIRNAVHHGIESPEERTLQGKPSRGTITLISRLSADAFEFDLKDDGRGLLLAQLQQKAVSLGIWNQQKARTASREDIAELIFQPGFSTAGEANLIAGRGMGMDIIRKKAEENNGTISVTFEEGQFCVFSIKFYMEPEDDVKASNEELSPEYAELPERGAQL